MAREFNPTLTAYLAPGTPLTPEQLRTVQKVVAGFAEDAEDLALLLKILGLS